MINYAEVRVKLTNTQLSKLKAAAKNNSEKTLRITKKTLPDKELSNELFLTTSQKSKKRNVLFINISVYIKFSKAQLHETIQSGALLGKTLGNVIGNLDKKALIDLAVSLTKDALAKLATKATSSAIDKLEREISWTESVRVGKGFSLFISNEYLAELLKS